MCVRIEREIERITDQIIGKSVSGGLQTTYNLKRRVWELMYLYLQYPRRSLSLYLLEVFGLEK